MNTPFAIAGASTFTFFAPICLARDSDQAVTPRYTAVALPELPGGSFCSCMTPFAINDTGDIAGLYFSPADQNHAFSIVDGTARDLGTFGGDRSTANAINNLGQTVGVAQVSENLNRAFIEQGGELTQLPVIGGIYANAFDINDTGVIVGIASDGTNSTRAAVWDPEATEPILIPTFGGEFNQAAAINESGVVVGWAHNAAHKKRAFSWTSHTGLTDLGTLSAGSSEATDVNDLGQAIGISSINDGAFPDQRAVMFEAGAIKDLGLVPEAGAPGGLFGPAYVGTIANAINNSGQVVGITFPRPDDTFDTNAAVLWEDGQATLLDQLIEPDSGWALTDAFDINDNGIIIGRGFFNGAPAGFMLTPVNTCPADLAEPFNQLDFSDVIAFLTAFANADPAADLAPPLGSLDFSDVLAFLAAFAAGCP